MKRNPNDMNDTNKAAAVFDKHAKGYQEKYMDLDLYDGTLDVFCGSVIKQNPDILDVACGPGNISRYLLKVRPDFKILGIDLAPNMIALALTNIPEAGFKVMDCLDILNLDAKYDGIVCGFIFPYLSKEQASRFIADAASMLNEGGVLYVSTMENHYSASKLQMSSDGQDAVFQHFYLAEDIKAMLEPNGVAVFYEQRIDFPNADGSSTTDVVIIGRK
ncbi:class I SAM-dependent methyltransferase [Flavobacterium pallidum]|uniref:Class I SAM-dependent methyltransferase n=1 Tax=Flavobacterium pallidum TaxID=2172098 RepID=A0A2S1SHV3_9FLAO|nr:class I SAM-dependent methyltransferase [Flavobacterium pallidum]AWI25994.1 class I SAM-dependent methyltransferase [Flavobacterium pallidum]